MAFPAQGMERVYRNDMQHVADYLNSKHQDRYIIFNLSERFYDSVAFSGQVLDFGWPDHQAPSFTLLIEIIKSIDCWLASDKSNVVVVHCMAGRGRTGTALCSYMLYSGIFEDLQTCLKYYAYQRSKKGQGVTQPSQLRYLSYVDRVINMGYNPRPKCLSINLISLNLATNMATFTPIIAIYKYNKHSEDLIYHTRVYEQMLDSYGPNQVAMIPIFPYVEIFGDVIVKIENMSNKMIRSKEPIARIIFNTGFLDEKSNAIEFLKKDIDIARKDSRHSSDFSITVHYEILESSEIDDWDDDIFNHWVDTSHKRRSENLTKLLELTPL